MTHATGDCEADQAVALVAQALGEAYKSWCLQCQQASECIRAAAPRLLRMQRIDSVIL